VPLPLNAAPALSVWMPPVNARTAPALASNAPLWLSLRFRASTPACACALDRLLTAMPITESLAPAIDLRKMPSFAKTLRQHIPDTDSAVRGDQFPIEPWPSLAVKFLLLPRVIAQD
jgi:hypothetical protein